ncbi:unnamed protein product [Psylliodes chrysocephalus]|uniref:Uncharacterized protein n=1 Tax=Psylliodes chrysocephalus TaxID=3402493 RepID=A0A9P0CT29_9CUCU|nr:unnamed protein product [Psylliodes chrysocephala]
MVKKRKLNDNNIDNDNVSDQVNEPTVQVKILLAQKNTFTMENDKVVPECSLKVFEIQIGVSEKAQVASYEIAELIAVKLRPHNLAEEIILPACRQIVKIMIGGSADIDICKIPLLNDTIYHRIKDMSQNIGQNTAKLLQIQILLYKPTKLQIFQEKLN